MPAYGERGRGQACEAAVQPLPVDQLSPSVAATLGELCELAAGGR